MHNHSKNWYHLQSILAGYETTYKRLERHSYEDHAKAKALSIFLANATLGTPKLDRETVTAILAAKLSWPHSPGTLPFEGVGLLLSLLEECGLVAFYGGWCTVHCQSLRNPSNVDQTLIQLVQAVEHLKDICYGRNGYIQPHYICPVDVLEKLLAAHFGSAPVVELLPELSIEDGYFKLLPGNQNFDSLVSTYLWQTLCEMLEPKEAFEHWILCLRVNCTWAMPVLFGDGDYEQRTEFNNQLLAYIAQDAGLSLPMDNLWKQAINESHFSSIVTPIETRINLTIGLDGNSRSEYQDTELEKLTLANLATAYSLPCGDDSSNLQFVRKWQRSGHWREPPIFYISLLANVIEANIHIDGQLLASHGVTEKLLELGASKPVLKHVLFNVLPEYGNFTYKIFLLSQPDTCDIALFYLIQQSFSNSRRDDHSFTQHFDKGFQQLVCHEYIRAIETEADCGNRLLKVAEFLGERCGLHDRNFSESYEYQFLLCLLENLSPQRVVQLGQVISLHATETEKAPGYQSQQHYWYLLGFWLIERLEDTGIDQSGTLSPSLKAALLNYYEAEFEDNFAGKRHSLEPNYFFSALPWHRLIGNDVVGRLLTLSNRCDEWLKQLSYSNESNFAVASAVKHYLQVLMCMGRLQRIPKDRERVAYRVLEIVRTLGFGSRDEATYLFDEAFYPNKFDLWPTFCSYTNLFQDSLYDDFVVRCLPLISLNQLFVLLENCTLIARTQKLQEGITERQSGTEDMGLAGLEQAFISASGSGHTAFATKLLDSAKAILAQDRFAKATNHEIVRIRKVWLSYEYKWQLMNLLDTSKHNPENFANAARQVQIPHEHHGNSSHKDQVQWQECERFRRYIIAASYCETEPKRCVDIMEALYKETKYNNYSFMLFKGRLALHEINQDTTVLRHALSQFLGSLDSMEPELMPTTWVATILDSYRQLRDSPKIDDFWMKLNQDQQARREILHPYCLALIARGDALIAQKIINRYRELNQQASDALEITDLMDELCRNLPPQLSMSQLVQVEREESQRSTAQLTNHYNQIVSKNFEGYVAIVGQGQSPEEFLKSVVLEVAQELLLRKKNLQLHQVDSQGVLSFRITKEDLINDWFTSLFDKRMAEARVGFRDQKRGGQSASGKSPGEIDGYITHATNKRLSIFEAFRIFSLDTKVISEHLNKIADYDNESLSPVFIVAYCDVSDFAELVRGYAEFIATQDYAGFTVKSETGRRVETQHNIDHLWLGMERRLRGNREITFYHLLLNMSGH